MYKCQSLILKRSEINRQKGRKGAAVREANRIAAHAYTPPLPSEITDDITITITRRVCGHELPAQEYIISHEEGRGRSDQRVCQFRHSRK